MASINNSSGSLSEAARTQSLLRSASLLQQQQQLQEASLRSGGGGGGVDPALLLAAGRGCLPEGSTPPASMAALNALYQQQQQQQQHLQIQQLQQQQLQQQQLQELTNSSISASERAGLSQSQQQALQSSSPSSSATTWNQLGHIYVRSNNLQQALQAFQQSISFAASLVTSSNSKNDSMMSVLLDSYSSMGSIFMSIGSVDLALEAFGKAKSIQDYLNAAGSAASAKPVAVTPSLQSQQQQQSMFSSSSSLPDGSINSSHRSAAQSAAANATAHARSILMNASEAYQNGITLLLLGQCDSAMNHLATAQRLLEHVHGQFHPDIAKVADAMGKLETLRGNFFTAIQFYQAGLAIKNQLIKQAEAEGPPGASFILDEMLESSFVSYASIAKLYLLRNEFTAAIETYQKLLVLQKQKLVAEPNSNGPTGALILQISDTYTNLGDLFLKIGEQDEAKAAFEQGILFYNASGQQSGGGGGPAASLHQAMSSPRTAA